MTDILEINDLSVYFGDKQILNNINLNLKKNKITALVGPSGCGKSTLLKTINLLNLEEDNFKAKGDIFLKGENINSFDKEELRNNIGLVFQKPTPFPLSIYDNLTYAPKYNGVKNEADLKQIVIEKLKMANLYQEIKDNLSLTATKLSGGQQQRLCIARTLTVEPEIIMLDEPCSSLDFKNIKKIEEMLFQLSKNHTILIVTHSLQQAKRLADYTAFVLDGRLIEYNQTETIFNHPKKEATKDYLSI